MLGIVLIVVAAALWWIDRRFGLSYVLAGFGASIAFVGVGLLLGFDLGTIEPFAMFFATLVFTPIAVRLFFVREIKRRQSTPANPKVGAEDSRDRNLEFLLQHAPRTVSLLQRFTFFFVQGTLLLLIGTGLFSSDELTVAHIAGIPAAASHQTAAIVSRYTASKAWQIIWGAVGLFVLGPLIVFFIMAYRLGWRIGWLLWA
jgi:hypothetical protein